METDMTREIMELSQALERILIELRERGADLIVEQKVADWRSDQYDELKAG